MAARTITIVFKIQKLSPKGPSEYVGFTRRNTGLNYKFCFKLNYLNSKQRINTSESSASSSRIVSLIDSGLVSSLHSVESITSNASICDSAVNLYCNDIVQLKHNEGSSSLRTEIDLIFVALKLSFVTRCTKLY